MDERDHGLLAALGEGDAQAIASLYQREGARMVAFAARFVGDRSAAEDVVVSLLGRWLERPPHIGSADRVGAFLATSVYRAAIDWIRRDRAQQGHPPRSAPDPGATDRRRAGPILDVVLGADQHMMRRRLERAMDGLSPSEKTLLESHYGHALTADECMESLGISRAAFHQRLHRARVHLARLLTREEANR